MRVVLIGQAAFGKEVLSGLLGRGHEVALVYAPPEKGGKPDPLAAEAATLGLELRTPAGYKTPAVAAEVAAAGADLGVLAFVTKIVPPAVIDAPRPGTICFHPSILPRYRGGSALAWQLIRGETRGGFTVFWTDPGIDTGPILLTREVEIGRGGEHGDAALASHALDAPQDGGEEGIAAVFEEDAERRRAPVGAAQGGRGRVGPVAELGGGGAHPLGHAGRHSWLVIDHPGDRLEAHPGQGRHVAHRGAPAEERHPLLGGRRYRRPLVRGER